MDETTAREKVLKKIRNALISKTENPYPALDMESSVYHEFTEPADITFAEQFLKSGGKFVYCENEGELKTNLLSLIAEKHLEEVFCLDPALIEILNSTGIPNFNSNEKLSRARASVTGCEFLVARFGSIIVSSKQASGRRANVAPEIHIVIAQTNQVVSEIKEAINGLKSKYGTQLPSMISLITGPSRTADIEKTLVLGAHGPRELYVFLLDEVKN